MGMSFPFFGREDQRRLLEAAFEPDEDGFLFYRDRWSAGIPVTPAEREEYLNIPALGSRRDFYQKIKGRPARGRRDYSSARIAKAFPAGWAVGLLGFGCVFLLYGASAEGGWTRWSRFGGGGMMIVLGLWLLVKRRG